MIRALWTAATGMEAQQFNIDVIANNLANVNTVGFKKSQVDFQDLLYETIRMAGSPSSSGTMLPTGIQVGHGTRLTAVQKIFTQGDFKQTQNPLDLAIEGKGFFQITLPNGDITYSRAGAFKVDADGQVVNPEGFLLEPAVTIPIDAINITIGTDGTISVIIAGQIAPQQVGQISLARFVNPAGLEALGRNLFRETEASGTATIGTPGQGGLGTVAQGFLEISNVNVVEEIVNMITSQRAYEINSRAIQIADEMLRTANAIRV